MCGRNVICADADCKVVEGGKDFWSRGTQRLDVRQCTGWGPPLTFHMGVVTWSAESEEGVEELGNTLLRIGENCRVWNVAPKCGGFFSKKKVHFLYT